MDDEYQHFKINPLPIKPKRKTIDYIIISKSKGCVLGHIVFHNHWRQHVFQPLGTTLWSKSCLEDVNHFLDKIKEERTFRNNLLKKNKDHYG